jgi:hypothetical protein
MRAVNKYILSAMIGILLIPAMNAFSYRGAGRGGYNNYNGNFYNSRSTQYNRNQYNNVNININVNNYNNIRGINNGLPVYRYNSQSWHNGWNNVNNYNTIGVRRNSYNNQPWYNSIWSPWNNFKVQFWRFNNWVD